MLTKKCLFIALSLFFVFSGFGQFGPTSIAKGDIYALIIGISEYKDEKIKDLNFSHRDAQVFADYLQSDAGGNVPKENIKLLTNEEATISNIYIAKQWLENKPKKNDLVFFYFSGHGDVESSLYELGFLLAHDTPHKNYLNNAVRIEDINNMANTLSVTKDVEVILITDACHSGKLSGSDNRGKFLVGQQLRKTENNEVRIASCGPDELAQEDVAWGGGRGAFSFHLINGMTGLADVEMIEGEGKDGIITLSELRNYVESKVSSDVFRLKSEEQTPVISGKRLTKMALVDETSLLNLIDEGTETGQPTALGGQRMVTATNTASNVFFRDYMKNAFQRFDFKSMANSPANVILKTLLEQSNYEPQGRWMDDSSRDSIWFYSLQTDPEQYDIFQQEMAAHLHNEVQVVINKYLNGDPDEMERRQYYNAGQNLYEGYIYMLACAEKLINPNNYLYDIIRMKKHYFSGLVKRFMAPVSDQEDPLDLVREAVEEQKKALKISSKAAYVHNELGVLHNLLGKREEGRQYFEKTLELVPNWSVTLSNLSNYYYRKGDFENSLKFSERSVKINPKYYLGLTNYAKSLMEHKDLLTAKDILFKAKKINDNHYIAYELLGHIFNDEGNYADANYYYLEADIRKRKWMTAPFFDDMDADGIMDLFDQAPPIFALAVDSLEIGDQDFIPLFNMGRAHLSMGNLGRAAYYFDKVIEIKAEDPLVYRYYGELFWRQKNWEKAELCFELADYHALDSLEFTQFYEREVVNHTYQNEAFNSTYLDHQYDEKEIGYFLGDLYTQWKRFVDAEAVYETMIYMDPGDYIPNRLYWDLLDMQGAYVEEEQAIQAFQKVNNITGFNALIMFYSIMSSKNINAAFYNFKKGCLLYDKVFKEGMDSHFASAFPRSIDYMPMSYTYPYKLDFMDREVSGTPAVYNYFYDAQNSLVRSLDTEDTLSLVRINTMLGDLDSYYGDFVSSASFYDKAAQLNPGNASYLDNAIEEFIKIDEYTKAYSYLNKMNSQNQLDHYKRLTLADFTSLSGKFDTAIALLEVVDKRFIDDAHEVDELIARAQYFKGEYDMAEEKYDQLIASYPDGKANYHYAKARIKAKKGKKKQAIKEIKVAIAEGWDYTWVLEYDPVMEDVKTHGDWDDLPKVTRE